MWGAIKKAINSNLNKSLDVLIAEKHLETNSKIDSKSSQSSVDAVKSLVQDGNNLIGSTNNNGGTATSGSIFAKLNKLLTDWTTTRAGYVDTTISSRATQAQINALEIKINNLQLALNDSGSYPSIDKCKIIPIFDNEVVYNYINIDLPLNMHIYYISINYGNDYDYTEVSFGVPRVSYINNMDTATIFRNAMLPNVPIYGGYEHYSTAMLGGKGLIINNYEHDYEHKHTTRYKSAIIDINNKFTGRTSISIPTFNSGKSIFRVYAVCKK